MNPKFFWEANLYDTQILGFGCAKISIGTANAEYTIDELIKNLKLERIKYAVARIVSSDYRTSQILEDYGFRLVDSLVELTMSLKDSKVEKVKNIRGFLKKDESQVMDLSAKSFSDTRFFNDPAIPIGSARKIYSKWVKNSIDGLAADRVLVYEEDSKIIGFVTIQLNGHIPLLAVDATKRGKGLGKSLCRAAVSQCISSGCDTAQIETQINNIAALRAYLSSGFKITNSYFTFRWNALS